MCMCMCICICICICGVCVYIYIYIYVYVSFPLIKQWLTISSGWPGSPSRRLGDETYLCVYIYIYIYTYIHTHVYIYIYIAACVLDDQLSVFLKPRINMCFGNASIDYVSPWSTDTLSIDPMEQLHEHRTSCLTT